MTDPITITTSALASFNHASNIIKSLFELKIDTSVVAELNQLNREIQTLYGSNLSLQQSIASLIEEKSNLKKEITRFETWEAQKVRYQLVALWNSASVAYALKESEANGEPPHWICTNCYEGSKRTILQPRKESSGFVSLVCPACYSEIHTNYRNIESTTYA